MIKFYKLHGHHVYTENYFVRQNLTLLLIKSKCAFTSFCCVTSPCEILCTPSIRNEAYIDK